MAEANALEIAQPDITLLLDMEGVIREAHVSGKILHENVDAWLGRRWEETVADVGNDKVRRMLADARTTGVSAFRQITQRLPSGSALPMEYTTVLLGGRAGLLAIGKSLQAIAELQSRFVEAQQTMERDYWKLREVETRYRLLFQASQEAIVILSASAPLRIVEANPAAVEAFELKIARGQNAAGSDIVPVLAEDERDTFQAMLNNVRDNGKAPALVLHLGRTRKPWMVRASLMNWDTQSVFMLQLSPMESELGSESQSEAPPIDSLMDRMPDGFVVVDSRGLVCKVNRAFLELIEVGSAGAVVGESLSRWLWRPGADLAVLLANVRHHGAARLLATTIYGELGTETDIEISATGDRDKDPEYISLLVRSVSRRLVSGSEETGLRGALGAIAEKVGNVPLRALVKQTVAVVEGYYVKSALQLAKGNRTMAAELLGLSRQSLYAKLDRYQLEESGKQIADGGE
jgi:transcriptional regulator PpsR